MCKVKANFVIFVTKGNIHVAFIYIVKLIIVDIQVHKVVESANKPHHIIHKCLEMKHYW